MSALFLRLYRHLRSTDRRSQRSGVGTEGVDRPSMARANAQLQFKQGENFERGEWAGIDNTSLERARSVSAYRIGGAAGVNEIILSLSLSISPRSPSKCNRNALENTPFALVTEVSQ